MNIKLYFNNSCLEISENPQQGAQDQADKTFVVNRPGSIKDIADAFLKAGDNMLYRIICSDRGKVLREMKEAFKYIEAAGGFIEREGEYLFILRHGLWDLPKGKREKDESINDCAVRECEEECGIRNLEIVRELHSSYHIYAYQGAFALKRSYWYYMRTDFSGPLLPQLEENILEARWFKREEIIHTILPQTYHTIKNVVTEALGL